MGSKMACSKCIIPYSSVDGFFHSSDIATKRGIGPPSLLGYIYSYFNLFNLSTCIKHTSTTSMGD